MAAVADSIVAFVRSTRDCLDGVESIADSIRLLEKELAAKSASEAALLETVRRLEVELATARGELAESTSQLRMARGQAAENGRQLAAVRAELAGAPTRELEQTRGELEQARAEIGRQRGLLESTQVELEQAWRAAGDTADAQRKMEQALAEAAECRQKVEQIREGRVSKEAEIRRRLENQRRELTADRQRAEEELGRQLQRAAQQLAEEKAQRIAERTGWAEERARLETDHRLELASLAQVGQEANERLARASLAMTELSAKNLELLARLAEACPAQTEPDDASLQVLHDARLGPVEVLRCPPAACESLPPRFRKTAVVVNRRVHELVAGMLTGRPWDINAPQIEVATTETMAAFVRAFVGAPMLTVDPQTDVGQFDQEQQRSVIQALLALVEMLLLSNATWANHVIPYCRRSMMAMLARSKLKGQALDVARSAIERYSRPDVVNQLHRLSFAQLLEVTPWFVDGDGQRMLLIRALGMLANCAVNPDTIFDQICLGRMNLVSDAPIQFRSENDTR